MFRYLFLAVLMNAFTVQAQIKTGWYRAVIQRADSVSIIFNAEAMLEKGKTVLYIRNDKERLKVDGVEMKGDSVLIDMPFFESSFQLKKQDNHSLTGIWIKGTGRTTPLQFPVTFYYGDNRRFKISQQPKSFVNGRWQVTFTRAAGGERPAVALFQQKGNYVSGSFITPSGDYRFLEGVINGSKLQLSCFDGSHAYYFTADVSGATIANGFFYSSASAPEKWRALKNSKAALPDTTQRTQLKEGETKLNFSFKDINGKTVSINDTQFKNKVVIIQLMGSWCPNCMDETEFLKGFYAQYKSKGVELIALAYELTLDETRSRTSLQKFINRFKITYPVLIAPATSGDSEKTEKTLPQLTPIRSFPTTIFIGRDGTVQKVHSGFYGPGTGVYHEEFKKEFYQLINRLLNGSKAGE